MSGDRSRDSCFLISWTRLKAKWFHQRYKAHRREAEKQTSEEIKRNAMSDHNNTHSASSAGMWGRNNNLVGGEAKTTAGSLPAHFTQHNFKTNHLLEKHEDTGNPGGNCYLFMTAASADTCARTHPNRHAAMQQHTTEASADDGDRVYSAAVLVHIRRPEVNEMRQGWRSQCSADIVIPMACGNRQCDGC